MNIADELNSGATCSDHPTEAASAGREPGQSQSLGSEAADPVAAEGSILEASAVAFDAAAKSPRSENPTPLALLPFFEHKQTRPTVATKTTRPRLFGNLSVAASLIVIVLISAGAVYDHFRQSTLLRENESLASTVNALDHRLDAIEVPRGRGESSDLKTAIDQMKAEIATSREFSANLAQLRLRVDRADSDYATRLEKLSERFDHDLSPRVADLAARLDKLEKKAASPAASPGATTPNRPPILERGDVVSSNDITGSIERPRPPLRGYNIAEVRDGYAVIESREGARPVAPGDFIPGAGRVLRIERHGREWAVITTAGVISNEPRLY
jgi:hypothetical protein